MKILDSELIRKSFKEFQNSRPYVAMYSSVFRGITKDKELMFLPIDDHMVHRGDGIFEATRFTPGKIFELEAHIDRLYTSAEYVSMRMPWSKQEISAICVSLAEVSGLEKGLLRLFVSRGPGDFSPNPYSTVGSQLYIIATPFNKMDEKYYTNGASLLITDQPIKSGFFPKVKSCNYLPNVLLKKEAVDKKFDFIVNKTADGYLAEGPTENILVLNQKGQLLAPKFDYTLRGTTLLRTLETAKTLQQELQLASVGLAHISEQELLQAKEVMMVGTTLGVLPITRLNSTKIPGPGPVAQRLNEELEKLF